MNAADAADARRDGHVLDALAAAGLQAVHLDIGALAEAVFSDGQNTVLAGLVLLGSDGHTDDVVVLGESDAAHAVGRTAHGADIVLVKANGHAQMRGQENNLAAVGDARLDQLIVVVYPNGDNPARHHVREVLERRLLHRALLRGKEDELAFFFKIAHRQNGAHILALLQVEQALHGFSLARGADVGNLIHLQPIHAAGVGKAQQKRVC